jgi:hypothetical protein
MVLNPAKTAASDDDPDDDLTNYDRDPHSLEAR